MLKKFLIGTFALAVLLIGVTASAAYDFGPTTLKVGSSGQYVMNVQTVVGAVPVDGLFGPMTKAKVMAWQASNGLVADGLVGPATKNAMNAGSFSGTTCPVGQFDPVTGQPCGTTTTLPAGCTSTVGFSPLTGVKCDSGSTTTLPAGCTSTVGFSPTTGAKCDGGTTVTPGNLTGGAADITLSNEAADTETEVAIGTSEKVEGFRVQATGGDVQVTNLALKLTLTDSGSNASNRIERYAKSFDVLVNGTKVGSVNADDLTRDSAGKYSGNIALSNAIVRVGEANRATFFVSMNAVSLIDSDDVSGRIKVEVTSLRFVDSTGAILTKTGTSDTLTSGISVSKTVSDQNLRMALTSDSPKVGVAIINETSTTEVDLLKFTLKAEGTDMTFDTVTVKTTQSAAAVTDYYLYRGSTRIADKAATTETDEQDTVFSTYSTQTLNEGDTATFRVVARLKSGNTSGVNGSTHLATTPVVTVENSTGSTVSDKTGSAVGETQTVNWKGIKTSGFTATETSSVTDSGDIISRLFTVKYTVTAFGEDAYLGNGAIGHTSSSAADGTATNSTSFAKSALDAVATYSFGAVTATGKTANAANKFLVADGTSQEFQVTVLVNGAASASASSLMSFTLGKVAYTVQAAADGTVTQFVPTPASSYKSAEFSIN